MDVFTVILTLLILPFKATQSSGSLVDSLYNQTEDGVINLDYTNFDTYIYGGNRSYALLVKFYASWCGHCKLFAPKLKKLSKDILPWNQVVRLSGVNCAASVNQKLCSDQHVMAYPTLKLFPPNTKTGDLGSEFILEDTTTFSMRKSIIRSLMKIESSNSSSTSWPQLFPINASTRRELTKKLNLTSSDEKPVLLVIEDESASEVGVEILLDLSSYQDFVSISRMDYKVAINLLNSLSVDLPKEKLPALIRLKVLPDHWLKVLILKTSAANDGPSTIRKSFVDHVVSLFLREVYMNPLDILIATPTDQAPSQSVDAYSNEDGDSSKVYMIDLYNALRYSFYQEILIHPSFNASQTNALKQFLTVLNMYFPFDDDHPRRLIRNLTQWIQNRQLVTASELQEAIKLSEGDGYLPPLKAYLSCRGSRPDLRGYPCSLWLLFHTLTVSEYKHLSEDKGHTGYLVLPAMREYVRYFFTCKECSYNFEEASKGLDKDLEGKRKNASVLWLWEKHNDVNKRLQRSVSEDPAHPKIPYPPSHHCPTCMTSNGVWNETQVLSFLIDHYQRGSLVSVSSGSLCIKPTTFFTLLVVCLITGRGFSLLWYSTKLWKDWRLDQNEEVAFKFYSL